MMRDILHGYEKATITGKPDTKEAILKTIVGAIKEYDAGQSEEWEMPF